MNIKHLLPMVCILLMISCNQEPNSAENKPTDLPRLEEFTFKKSNFIDDKIYSVYLPKSYGENTDKSYPVLYLMDGQVQFGGKSPFSNYSWNSHEVVDSLIQTGTIEDIILVGVNHAGDKRFEEYMPQKPLDHLPKSETDSIRNKVEYTVFSDAYLKFLTRELKPHIDKKYRTLSDVNNTFIGGSSMGALISMYAACDYPDIFGGAICMSTHWPVSADNSSPFIADEVMGYFEKNLPQGQKWYFDLGTEGLDKYYEHYQITTDIIMKEQGYTRGKDFITIKLAGHDHNEFYWNQRLKFPLTFLFKKADETEEEE